jgi:phenylpropionate dioxygenase-like ring-hydroxylating dioxygenase large terminal subunit
MLLGEKLIAFRDSAGRVGVMDHRCAHRCAFLFLGRNEEGGIRCVYHGWKYDVAGNCVDMPSLPPHHDFRRKVRAKAYQVVERCGLIWVYMGVRTEAPPLPALEILDVPSDEIGVSLILRECNYLQALEGDIDTSHFGFLHTGHVDPDDLAEGNALRHTITTRAPEYRVTNTAWGTQYAAYRPAGQALTYWRFGAFLFPFWSPNPHAATGFCPTQPTGFAARPVSPSRWSFAPKVDREVLSPWQVFSGQRDPHLRTFLSSRLPRILI